MGLIKGLQDSYRIAIKDLMEFERNRIGLMFLFLMPFFMLIMTGFIFPTGSSYTNIPVAVVDMDHSQASQQFIAQLEGDEHDKPNPMVLQSAATIDDAKTLIRQRADIRRDHHSSRDSPMTWRRENRRTSPCYPITASRRYRWSCRRSARRSSAGWARFRAWPRYRC